MMRYQGLSPDNLPLSNGRRSHWRTCKEEDGIISSREFDDDSTKSIPTFAEGHKGIPRFRSPSSKTQDQNFSPYTGSVPNSPPHPKTNHYHQHEMSNSPVHNGDVLLQWGHRKRSRLSRSIESRAAGAAGGMTVTTDESSSSSSIQIQAMINVKRRSISLPTPGTVPVLETKNAANANIMPPPSSLLPTTISITAAAAAANITSTSNGKGGSLKSCSKDTSAFVNRRNSEDRSAGGSGSHPPRNGGGSSRTGAAGGGGGAAAASSTRSKLGKRSPSKVIEKHDHNKRSITTSTTTPCSSASLRGDDKVNGFMQQEGGGIAMNHHHNIIGSAPLQEAGCGINTTNHHDDNVNATSKSMATAAEKVANGGGGGGEVNEWPRVYIPLTRKEKEEDFLVMKGTKLPHRPKKRPKAVDRMLQYCFPGMWLSDVTKARYEVKEKKSSTKKPKRRGLKGMESMDSDSE